MTTSDLRFPVLCFSGKLMVAAHRESELSQGTTKAIQDGYFDEVMVVDSEGKRIRLRGAKAVGSLAPLAVLRRLIGLPVRLEFLAMETLPPISLSELRDLIVERLGKAPGFWSTGGPMSTIKRRVQEATDFEALIAMFY